MLMEINIATVNERLRNQLLICSGYQLWLFAQEW